MMGQKSGRDFVNLEDLRNLKSKSTDLIHCQYTFKFSPINIFCMILIIRHRSKIMRLAIVSAVLAINTAVKAQCTRLVWSDEFDGSTLDLTKWTPQIGDGCDINLCGWGNNELEYYRAENAVVSNGTLKIIARRENFGNRSYTSARLRTINKGDWTYGRFEARMKLPIGQGMWPAFWMLPTDEAYGFWPQSGEIDIMELVGKEPQKVLGTIHYGNPWPNNSYQNNSFSLHSGTFNDDFHIFAIEWEPGAIRWYVDDYLYSTKTSADVAPLRWPFDKRFYFLLNLAVGGNWPGNPDGSTLFPQTMEVDYVRVYDGKFPHIIGKRKVANRAEGEVYTLNNVPAGSAINWTVPAGASILSGQGANSISVNWGNSGGEIVATINNGCYNRQIALNVAVEAALAYEFSFENFDQAALINLFSNSGALTQDVANPAPDAINASTLCGRYVRNSSQQFDVLQYNTSVISNAALYFTGQKKFFIDIYTDAPPNTLVLLQLEDSALVAPANYPIGRHSRYEAFTTIQNKWQRLVFTPLDQPDPSTPGTSVNRLVLLFASNSFTGNTFFFDNFDSYASITTSISSLPPVQPFRMYPNPASEFINIENTFNESLTALAIYDTNGRELLRHTKEVPPNSIQQLNTSKLPAGVYWLRVTHKSGQTESKRFVRF